jgi:hypothetical protein
LRLRNNRGGQWQRPSSRPSDIGDDIRESDVAGKTFPFRTDPVKSGFIIS